MRGPRLARQLAWARALVALVCLAAGVTLAQDPRASTAQKSARDWLELFDKGDVPASREAAGAKFKESIDSAGWSDAVKGTRAQLGAVERRTMMSTKFDNVLSDGGPTGDFAVVVFRVSYTKAPEAYETITLERESDGVWRVIGFEKR